MEEINPALLGVIPVSEMQGDEADDTKMLCEQSEAARRFIKSFRWCNGIREEYFGIGVGGVFAVFLFKIVNSASPDDQWLWVVSGDIPSAYLVLDEAKSPVEALRIYVEEMKAWVTAVRAGQSLEDVYPVELPATASAAETLEKKLGYLKREFIDHEK